MIHRFQDYLRLELIDLIFPPRFLAVRLFAAGEVDGLRRDLPSLELSCQCQGIESIRYIGLLILEH